MSLQLLMARARMNHQSSAPLVPSLLMHFDGTNGSTVFTDAEGLHTMTRFGNAIISTAQSKFGGSSGYFDGISSSVTTPASADLIPGSGDFGFDCWCYQTGSTTQWKEIFMANTQGGLNIMLYDAKLVLGREGIANDHTAPAAITQNAWNHLEVSKKSNVVYLFVNGTLVLSAASTFNYPSGAISIGGKTNGVSTINGYIDELRYVNGRAIHTSSFTPPTAPYAP